MGSSSLVSPGRPRAGPARRAWRGGPVWSVPEGVLDLRSGLLGVALELLPAALGPQAPVAGQPADGLLGAAFDYLGLMRNLPGETHGAASRRHPAGAGASAGTSAASPAAGSERVAVACRGAGRRPNRCSPLRRLACGLSGRSSRGTGFAGAPGA